MLEALFNKVARLYDLDKLQRQKDAGLKRKESSSTNPVAPKRPMLAHPGSSNFQNMENQIGFTARPEIIDRSASCRFCQRNHPGGRLSRKQIYMICLW